jgi:hypothetical protein
MKYLYIIGIDRKYIIFLKNYSNDWRGRQLKDGIR